MIKVVLLAAGKSTRTTDMKQLYLVDGEYLINIQIRKLISYGFKVVVVLGHRYKEVLEIIDKRVEVVHNAEYEEGMFCSVKSVFRVCQADRFIFCHTDRPIADKDVFLSLIKSPKDIAVAFCCEKKAPPIMMKYSVKNCILSSNLKRLDFWIESQEDVEYTKVSD